MNSRESIKPFSRCTQMRQKQGLLGGNCTAFGEAGLESRGHWRRWSLTRPQRACVPALGARTSAVVAPRTNTTRCEGLLHARSSASRLSCKLPAAWQGTCA